MINHNGVIDINVQFSAVPVSAASFGGVAVFAEGQSGYADDSVTVFTSTTQIGEAEDAGDIDAATANALRQPFLQLQSPQSVLMVNVEATADANAYETAYQALLDSGQDFYGVTQVVNTDPETQIALAGQVENSLAAQPPSAAIYALETDNSEWADAIGTATGGPYESGVGTWEDLQAYERTGLVWRDALDANKPAAEAWLGYRLTFSPDRTYAQFTGELRNVDSESIDATQKSNLSTNAANLVLPFFNAPARILDGVNLQGRPLSIIRTGDWLRARVQERLATLALDYDRRGLTINIDEDGQRTVFSEAIKPVLDRGIAVESIDGDSLVVSYPDITQDDLNNLRIPINVEVTTPRGAVRFQIGVFVNG